MATVINININGYSVSQTSQTTPEPFRGYTLLPGFTATRELFGERKIKAKKKKNCTNGQVCGFSCISKTKVCIANMTTAQLKEHNAAKRAEKKAAKAGGAAATPQTETPNEMTATPKNAVPKIVNSPQVSMKEKGLRTSSDKLAELLTNGNDTWEYLEAVELSQRFNQKELAVLSGEFAKALNFRMEEQDD